MPKKVKKTTPVRKVSHVKKESPGAVVFKEDKSQAAKDFPHAEVAYLSSLAYKSLHTGTPGSDLTRTLYDKWDSTILSHLVSRQLYYGLPSINTDNGLYGLMQKSETSVAPIVDSLQIDAAAIAFGVSADSYGMLKKTNLQGRYNYYTGLINDSITLTVQPNSSSIWVCSFRPDQTNAPIILMDSADNLTASTACEVLDWTQNPFYGATEFFPSQYNSAKLKKFRKEKKESDVVSLDSKQQLNAAYGDGERDDYCTQALQFTGGYEMEIEHINKTAYTSTAFKLRTSSNTIHDFFQLYDSITSDSINLGSTSGFQESRSAYMATSGTRWSTIGRYTSNEGSIADPDFEQCASSLQFCILNDLPVFQVVVTNSGPDVSSIVLNFKVQGWHGVAPTSVAFAGSMAYQTVPFTMPAWPESCKTVGSVKKSNAKEDLFVPVVTAAHSSLSSIVPRAVQHPPTVRALITAPSMKGKVVVPENRTKLTDVIGSFGDGMAQTALETAFKNASKAGEGVMKWLFKHGGEMWSGVKKAERVALPLIEDAAVLVA